MSTTVLKHDDVHDRGQHLLQNFRLQLKDAQEVGVVGGRNWEALVLTQPLEEEGQDVVESSATASVYYYICE